MAFTLTDILLFGSAATEDSGTLRILRNQILQFGATGRAVVVGPAVSPLSLPDAIADSLTYVKAFGGTQQNGTPTPDAPVDIASNNGAIKFSLNEANYTADNIVLGYWLRNSDGQPEASSANFYTNMMPVKPNVSYVCFGRNKQTNAISSYNRIAWYDADGVWIRNSTYTQNQPGIDVAPTNAAFARFHCNINGAATTQELVDSYNWVFQQGTAEVPYTPYSPTGIYTDGTVETIKDTIGNTATAEMLLKVGDYQDVQSILDGVVTRKVGIKVLDGTEDWLASGNLFYAGIATDALEDTHSCYCAHFKGVATNASASYDNEIKVGTNATQTVNWTRVQIYPVVGTYSNVTAFKQWLADQYAAGTPVIVVYPLATATTESVTGQTLQVQDGDNTLEITQASLNNLELEAKYMKQGS